MHLVYLQCHKVFCAMASPRHNGKLRSLVLMGASILLLFIMYRYYFGFCCEETVNMNKLLAVSMHLAKKGGDRLWSIRKGHMSGSDSASLNSVVKGKTKEGADELLTQGDLESHTIIYSGLKAAFPGLKVIQC
jgi:Golgi-resident PAP phosphatase